MEVSVNTLVEDLLRPTTEVTRAIAAVAQGNLTQTVRLDVDGRPLEGEFLRSANIVNTMIQQLGVFTAEVTRVAREVGTDGKLGGQAQVPGVAGTWKDLTDSVNSMATNLTGQVRNIAEVATAVASGDLSRKITVDVRGEILQLKEAINTMVDQLRSFASEVTRVAREVGTDGKLGGQAVVPGVAGTWKDLTDSVNAMAGNLTAQVTKHCRSDDGRGPRRLVAQNHRRREGRNSRTERHHQHDGGPAERVRRRSDARGPRSGNGRQARRPGQRARCGRNVEGSHRQRELHGRQPDRPGPKHRGSRNRHRQRRSLAQDHRRRARRNSAAQRNAEHDGGSAQPVRRRSDARGPRSGNRRTLGRPGQRARCGRNLEGSDGLGQLDGRQPYRPGQKHCRSHNGRGPRRLVPQDHGRREGRNSRTEEHHQHDGGPAERIRRRSDARGARSGHRRQARRPGAGIRRRRNLEGSYRQRQLHGLEPHRPGPQHRRSGDGRGPRRLVAQDHRRREGRNSRTQRHHQHDGRPAQRLRRRSDARGPRSGHGRQARRPGAGAGRRRNVEGSHRLRELDGLEPHRPGEKHRRSFDGHRDGRSFEEDHRERQRRNSAAERNHQHDGRPAQPLRRRSNARGPRSGNGRPSRRSGQRARRRRNVEGSYRLGELDGRQPHGPGAKHRRSHNGRGPRRPLAQDHRRREGRNSRAQEHHQHDGRPAQRVRRRSDARGSRSGHRRQARRPGAGARCRRNLEGSHRLRELHGRQPHGAGKKHR